MGPLAALALTVAPAAVAGGLACSSADPADEPAETGSQAASAAATGAGGAGAGGGGSFSGGAGVGGGPGPTGDITGVVRRYDYAFDLATSAAHAKLTIDVPAPGGDCFATACELPAAGVTWNGAPAASAAVEAGALSACGAGVEGGGTLVLEADAIVPEKTFSGLDIGLSHTKDMAGGTFSYLLSWVGGCDRFGPCDDHPSRLVELHFEVKHPKGTVVLCPGALTVGDELTGCDLEGTLAPTYSGFAIAADPLWKRADFAEAAGVNLVFYEVPGGELAAALDPAGVTSFFAWITELLGPFPYGSELRLAGGPTAWLGFEHPANIVLREDLPALALPYGDGTMHVLMHEIAHQWAGDRTTLASEADFVWKEATAEYLAYVFEDEQMPDGHAAKTRAYWDGVSLKAQYHPRPTDEPTPPLPSFYGDVYGPGPMVLYLQLEAMLGRDAVLDGIRAFLKEPGARSVEDLRTALEAASGEDLAAYFDAWVFGEGKPEWPTFEASVEQADGTATVTLEQVNPSGTLYGCAVEVRLEGATKSTTAVVEFGLAPESPKALVTVPFDEPVESLVVDPEHRIIDRKANAAPTAELPVWIF